MASDTCWDISASYEVGFLSNFGKILMEYFFLSLLTYLFDIAKFTITKKIDPDIISLAEN